MHDHIKLKFINLFEYLIFRLFYFPLKTRICPQLYLKNQHFRYFNFLDLNCLKQIAFVLQLSSLLVFSSSFHRFFEVFKNLNLLSFFLSYFQNAHVNFVRHLLCRKNSFFFLQFEWIRSERNFKFHCCLLVNPQEWAQPSSSCC